MLKSRAFFFFILLVLTAAYVGGCRNAGNWLVKEDLPEHADAMVLLMGSFPDRVLEVVDLFDEGRADRVIIVEESMGAYRRLKVRGARIVSNSKQAANSLVALGIPADSITLLPGDARSTLDEAITIRDYTAGNASLDTLLLVSSPAHMRRASMIFKAVFSNAEKQVYIGCCPSAYSGFNAGRWWRSREDIQTTLSEYVKIVSFVVFERGDARSR